MTALRFDDNKLRLDLIPPEMLIELARVFTVGASKYSEENWRQGMDWSRCMGALMRHYIKWRSGLSVDPETGCHHLALVAWNALALMIYQQERVGRDNRIINNPIDEAFNYLNNHLNIGLSSEALHKLKKKFDIKKSESLEEFNGVPPETWHTPIAPTNEAAQRITVNDVEYIADENVPIGWFVPAPTAEQEEQIHNAMMTDAQVRAGVEL